MNLHDTMIWSIMTLGILIAYFGTRSALAVKESISSREVTLFKGLLVCLLLGYVFLAISAIAVVLKYIFKVPAAQLSRVYERYTVALVVWLVLVPVVLMLLPFRPRTSTLAYDDDESPVKKASILVWMKSYVLVTCLCWLFVWRAHAQP